ncbi:MAG: capsid assembly protein [Aquabacterium sp.]
MSEKTPEQVAHEQAMIQKVDAMQASLEAASKSDVDSLAAARGAQEQQPPARPDNVPEQFWDAEKGQINQEALLKAYQEATAGKQGQEGKEQPQDAQQAAEQAVQSAGLNMADLQAEFDSTGALSEKSYEALAKVGIPKELVDAHIAGMEALAVQIVNEAYSVAGGEDAFKSMVQWAATNAPADSIDAFNKAMAGSPAERKQAIVAMRAQYEAAVGKNPTLTSGASGSSDARPFASRAEVTAAMSDPRYQKDPAYRAEVMRRLDAMDNF